jgi:hypothetical protein
VGIQGELVEIQEKLMPDQEVETMRVNRLMAINQAPSE